MCNKDNPVPSLDNLYTEWSKSNNNLVKSQVGISKVKSFGRFILNKLQNGVETDKEQPIITDKLFYGKGNPKREFRCINPTSTLTKDKVYEGYSGSHWVNWSHLYIDNVHVINDKGQHRTYRADRFKIVR